MKLGTDRIPLAQLRQEILDCCQQLGVEEAALNAVKHRAIHGAVLDGLLPARRENGRWYVLREDLPKIAETLGVLPQRRPGRPRKVAASSSSAAVAA